MAQLLNFANLANPSATTAPAPAASKKTAEIYINVAFPMKTADGSVVNIPLPLGIPVDFLEVNAKTFVGNYTGEDRKQMQSAVKYLVEQLQAAGESLDAGTTIDLGEIHASLQRRSNLEVVTASPTLGSFSFMNKD